MRWRRSPSIRRMYVLCRSFILCKTRLGLRSIPSSTSLTQFKTHLKTRSKLSFNLTGTYDIYIIVVYKRRSRSSSFTSLSLSLRVSVTSIISIRVVAWLVVPLMDIYDPVWRYRHDVSLMKAAHKFNYRARHSRIIINTASESTSDQARLL